MLLTLPVSGSNVLNTVDPINPERWLLNGPFTPVVWVTCAQPRKENDVVLPLSSSDLSQMNHKG